MKPLRDEFDPNDPNAVAGAALLSRVPPLEDSTARRRRVRITLQVVSPARSARIFGPLLVAALLLVAATGATAGATRLWKRSRLSQVPETTARAAIDAAPRAPATPVAPVMPMALETKLAPALPASDVRPAEPAASGVRSVASAGRLAAAPKTALATRAVTQPPANPASGPDASLMVEAMHARKAGDASRAAALLAEYQHKYPQGAFQEEALALSIESAAARGSESAPRLATDYLRRYPSGRFRELAQRALKSGDR